jgi:hypothetical protein
MRVRWGVSPFLFSFFFLLLLQLGSGGTAGAGERDFLEKPQSKNLPRLEGVLVQDGSNVHNAGELRMHVGNWGLFGSWPSAAFPFSFAPSAEWPAGSGVEHLFGAGLWVGAVKGGVPAVSTSLYETELRPTQDPIDVIYRSFEGAPGGNRLPHPMADDDGDGAIDEDWLNGRDDDGDGLVDEDFAAISNQMFSCWYTDNQPVASQIYPEHNPLDVLVRQESYQWSDDRFDDFVAAHFTVTNIGADVLEDVYIGVFADTDIGPRDTPNYWMDDAVGFYRGVACTDLGSVELEIAYGYDVDGDGGRTPGYFGILLLGCTTDPLGVNAPRQPRVCTYANFSGNQSFEQGGDPTNDFERYELLSQETIERDVSAPNDHRTLVSVGPFESLAPGETVEFHVAFVVGAGLEGMLENAASAKRFYEGTWFNIDGDPGTGVDRRETAVHGPAANVVIDACRTELAEPIAFVPEGTTVWVNADCEREALFVAECGYAEADSAVFRTGVGGRERQIHWNLGSEPARVWLDILPGRCPNRFLVKPCAQKPAKNEESMAGGVFRAALLGRPDFDVAKVDLESLLLEGVRPVGGVLYHDVGTEPTRAERACVCPGEKPDGIVDLVLKFPEREFIEALQPVSHGEERFVTMTGRMTDGREFVAAECVVVEYVGEKGQAEEAGASVSRATLRSILPNPFNPVTRIAYFLPQEAYVSLSIYDVSGRLVERLVGWVENAGDHAAEWDATGVSSGIYFCRFEAAGAVETRKLVVNK